MIAIDMSFSEYTTLSTQELFKKLKTSIHGLSKPDIDQRLKEYGGNVILENNLMWWHILIRQFSSYFIYLLLGAAVIAFFLGEAIDGLMILLFIGINAMLGFYQEYKSEQTIKLLKKLTVSKAKVIRDGKQIEIENQYLVPGDIVTVEAGDIVPSDIRLITIHNLTVNESNLTGESVPVEKINSPLENQASELHLASNIAFCATTVISGIATGIVFATGSNTVIGKISKLTSESDRPSSFEKELKQFSVFILRLVVVTLVLVFVANLAIKGNSNITQLLLFSLALAVSVVPEALPVVTTYSLSRGALKLAKHKVVVKRLSAIEDLGSIDVLCSDKTGTLTENQLSVAEVYSEQKDHTLFLAVLTKQSQDPFDQALYKALSPTDQRRLNSYNVIDQLPFDPNRKRNSTMVKYDSKNLLVVRGVPELLISYCKNISVFEKRTLEKWMIKEGNLGRRIIAVATREIATNSYTVKDEEEKLVFLGLISFYDPIKRSANHAIKVAEKLGVVVKILTGDSKEVAQFVGYQIGLIKSYQNVITGDEFEKLSESEKSKIVMTNHVFARVSPNQKFQIIQELQKQNYQVGFLGEGINDAPALKIANVGLAVKSASDIARSASDIILLEKSLDVIIDSIKEGREIFANTIKYIKATLSSNFGNFYAIAISSLLIDYLPMLPLQILLVNLLTDFPMIAVATDTVDQDEISKPKGYSIKEIAFLATILGIVSTVFDFIFFGIFSRFGEQTLQTNWFIGSILTELLFLYSIRTKKMFLKAKMPSFTLIILTVAAASASLIIPFTTIGNTIFRFKAPTIQNVLLVLAIVFLYFISTEVVKLLYYSKDKKLAK